MRAVQEVGATPQPVWPFLALAWHPLCHDAYAEVRNVVRAKPGALLMAEEARRLLRLINDGPEHAGSEHSDSHVSIGNDAYGGPTRTVSLIEDELAGDILAHRRQAVEASWDPSMRGTARAYRAYLVASVAFVEAVLNRLVGEAVDNGTLPAEMTWRFGTTPPGWQVRFREWLPIMADDANYELDRGIFRDFDRLRRERNKIVHGLAEDHAYEMSQVASALGWCRTGAGKMAMELQGAVGLDARPSHRWVARAAKVVFVR